MHAYLRNSKFNHQLNNYEITKELQTLKSRTDIKITLSDKNLGLVIFDTITYHKHMINILQSNSVYKLISPETDIMNYLSFIMPLRMNSLKNLFNHDELKFIHAMAHKFTYFGIFHGLPKLHKNKPIHQMPFRPIIAGRPHQLQARVSTVLSTWLLPFLKTFPTILKDSFDLKDQIENKSCHNHYFVTLDFESLYTSIPLEDLYLTILSYNESMEFNKIKFSTVKILQFLFKNNYFTYANNVYQQTDGIAMGTNVAPIIANLYLAIKFDSVAKTLNNIIYFHRFIDDCFFLYNGDPSKFESSELQILKNAAHPIKITYNISASHTDFLDTTIYNNNNSIGFRIFQKPLNQYHYIPQFSNHPAHNLTGFIKGELIRYRRLSTADMDYSYIKSKFYERLLKRGYTKNILNPIFYNQELFKPKPNTVPTIRNPEDPITFNFVIRHNLEPHLCKSLKKEFDLLANYINQISKDIKIKIRISYKSNPNIKRLTTSSLLSADKINYINNN